MDCAFLFALFGIACPAADRFVADWPSFLRSLLVTEIGQWISVALGRHRVMWDSTTNWQVAGLVPFTIGTIASLIHIRGATKAVAWTGTPDAQPDWLADDVSFGIRTSGPWVAAGIEQSAQCVGSTCTRLPALDAAQLQLQQCFQF